MLNRIQWLGHSSFRFIGKPVVYIDPWKLTSTIAADYILITHDHYDHFSLPDIERVRKPTTTIIGPQTCQFNIPGLKVVAPSDSLTFDNLRVESVPAYNINKKFHPKSRDRVGYILTIDGFRIYHAGDTDLIPEMNTIRCDIALLPISGVYVMTADEAVQAAEIIQCSTAIPMHWGDVVGSRADAVKFKKNASCQVVILERVE